MKARAETAEWKVSCKQVGVKRNGGETYSGVE